MDRHANAALVDDRATARRAQIAPGTCVAGKYIICDVLGTGGSAIVYAAEQVGLKRVVAFKLYPATGERAAALLARFEREAQLLARVHHENVVAVFDAGSMPDGSPYLVVQRLQGESLATRLLEGPLPIAEAVQLSRQVLGALAALSEEGITHRDVKPGNLVYDLSPDGRTVLKLVDFGIAKESSADGSYVLDELVGTPRYMAPEQIRGEPLDARCDLYALGVTLYEMLCGRTPHDGETVHEIARATLFAPITPLSALRTDCPEALSQIVMQALARDPNERFASAFDMLEALDDWQHTPHGAAVAGRPAARPERLVDTLRLPRHSGIVRKRARSAQRAVSALTLAAALGCLALVHALIPRSESARPAAASAVRAPRTPRHAALLEAQGLWGELRAQASATSSELLKQVRASARDLLDSVQHEEPREPSSAQ